MPQKNKEIIRNGSSTKSTLTENFDHDLFDQNDNLVVKVDNFSKYEGLYPKSTMDNLNIDLSLILYFKIFT